MKATIGNVQVEGTVEEVAKLLSMIDVQEDDVEEETSSFFYTISVVADDKNGITYNISTNSPNVFSALNDINKEGYF